jgi:hypothetical protein
MAATCGNDSKAGDGALTLAAKTLDPIADAAGWEEDHA